MKSHQLLELYEDKDGTRQEEITSLLVKDDCFDEFYKRLSDIKQSYKHQLDLPIEPLDVAMKKADKQRYADEFESLFSGEENFGMYLDLNQHHNVYVNLKGIKPVNYIDYLDIFDIFDFIPKTLRISMEYKRYLDSVLSYLKSFIKKSKPLLNLEKTEAELLDNFEKKWNEKEIRGWTEEDERDSEDLFCAACCKQFAKKTVYDAHLKGKTHSKAAERNPEAANSDVQRLREEKKREQENRNKVMALSELMIKKYMQVLDRERINTKDACVRKQTLTLDEFIARGEEEAEANIEVVSSDDESDKEEKIRTGGKLPLGWDGKPIPYWLYKLHGLDKEFPCEICGNFVYMGRKAYQKHFQEWRHSQGMRALQIPNTIEFQDITKIQDAIALWEKIRTKQKSDAFQAEFMEEFEDAQGNVLTKKTFDDLKRQGILYSKNS